MAEEEYKIIEDEQERIAREREERMREYDERMRQFETWPLDRLYELRKSFFKNRRSKIKWNGNSANGVFSKKLVKDLLEIDEISLIEAIDLDFYMALNEKDKEIWRDHCNEVSLARFSTLITLGTQLSVAMSEMSVDLMLAKTALNRAKVCCMTENEYEKMNKNVLNKLVHDNRKIYLNETANLIDAMSDTNSHFCTLNEGKQISLTIKEALEFRGICAREYVKLSRRLDLYQMADGGPSNLNYLKAIRVLTNSASREVLNWARDTDKNLRKLRHDFDYEARNSLGYSVVRILENTGPRTYVEFEDSAKMEKK